MAPFDPEVLAQHRRLAARMAAGESEAVQLLFLETAAMVNGIVRHILEDPDEAAAVVQETFLRAWRRAAAYGPAEGEVASWLISLAREVALERMRHGAAPALRREAARHEVRGTGVEALTAQQCHALALAFFSGCSMAEIASAMQTTALAALGHLRDALRKIRIPESTVADETLAVELARHWLGEIDPQRRAALQARVAAEPAVAADAGRAADALARFATDTAPAEPLMPVAQRSALLAIRSVAGEGRDRDRGPKTGTGPAWTWPLVSAGLAVLVIFLGVKVAEDRAPAQAEGPPRPTAPAPAADRSQRVEQLRADYATLKQANDILRADYEALTREIAARATPPLGVERLDLMELVDAATYAHGERRGLTGLARGILTSPGLVAVSPSTTTKPGPPATTSASGQPRMEAALDGPPPVGPVSPAGARGPLYGWSVFDTVENRGYLNLYNLPNLRADERLLVWVRPAEAKEFVEMGEVPAAFAGSSGSVQFHLAEGSAAPVEIMITREARDLAGKKPSSEIVLRGP